VTYISGVAESDCGVNLMADRCGEDIGNVFRNLLNRLENELGCRNGVFSFKFGTHYSCMFTGCERG